MDRLDAMRAFARVAERGSFSAGARELGISKALVSKHVQRLEEHLGARLLNRTTRRVSLTEVGRAYYEQCVDVLGRVTELEAAVQVHQREPRGHLRISGPRVFGEDVLVPCVRDFCARYPQVTVDVMLEERLVDIVAEGFDVAVRIGRLTDSSMIARRVADYRYVLCAAPSYLARAGTPETPEDLRHHTAIVNTALTPTDQFEFQRDGNTFNLTVRPKIRVNSGRPVRDFVLNGDGIGLCLLPTVKQELETGALVRLLERFEAYSRYVSVVYPHSRHLSAKVRAFIDHMVQHCETH